MCVCAVCEIRTNGPDQIWKQKNQSDQISCEFSYQEKKVLEEILMMRNRKAKKKFLSVQMNEFE